MSTPKKGETILGRLLALLERGGDGVIVQAKEDAELLVVGGEPIDGPVVAYGPLVMNTRAEIRQPIEDYWLGRMGSINS